MAAAANESQGLKIAVAVFVSLTVIMSVLTYFSYSAYTSTDAKLQAAEGKAGQAQRAAEEALRQSEALQKDIGVKASEADAIKTEIKNEYKKIEDKLKASVDEVTRVVGEAQSKGATGPELEDAKSKVQAIAAAYRSEPNKTYISALDRLTDLTGNMSMLTTQVALNYVDVKRSLESANTVNDQKLQVETKAKDDSKSDLSAEHDKHVKEREDILAKLDNFESLNQKQLAEIATLNSKIREMEDDNSKRMSLAQQTIREYRDRLERTETVLDRPDGTVTFVDYIRGEVHTSVSRTKGARPQMQFSIFDRNSPGIPTDKPKGSIQLVSVGDRESVAKIVKTNSSIDPIAVGDIVYSAAWSPNEPMRFALIGKIDINRDGVDDRQDLKRMIEAAGGKVDYDLPPPEAGKETGKLTGQDAWYVVDERPALRDLYKNYGTTITESSEFLKKQADAVREARLNGVRPMRIERLLPYLGYDYQAPIRGRAEATNTSALRQMLSPREDAKKAAPEGEPKPDDAMPKEEKKDN